MTLKIHIVDMFFATFLFIAYSLFLFEAAYYFGKDSATRKWAESLGDERRKKKHDKQIRRKKK